MLRPQGRARYNAHNREGNGLVPLAKSYDTGRRGVLPRVYGLKRARKVYQNSWRAALAASLMALLWQTRQENGP